MKSRFSSSRVYYSYNNFTTNENRKSLDEKTRDRRYAGGPVLLLRYGVEQTMREDLELAPVFHLLWVVHPYSKRKHIKFLICSQMITVRKDLHSKSFRTVCLFAS